MKAEVVLLIGANPTSNHPVAATWIKNAVKNGTKLIVADPRRSDLARHATHFLQFKPDTDVALLNAMMHTIVHEGLVDEDFIREPHHRLRRSEEKRRQLQPGGDGAALRHPGRDHQGSRAALREIERLDDFVGHGHLAAYSRHRQCALPDCAVHDDRPDRPSRHRAAPAARPEQRAGRVRFGSDPDVLSRIISASTTTRRARASKSCGAPRSIRKPGPDRGRDHGRGARRQNPRHVHHGREPGDVGPRCAPRARSARQARLSGGAGNLPDRDLLSRRRDPAGDRVAGEDRHRHQYRPHGAARPPGARRAGRGQTRSVDHPGNRAPHGPRLELRRAARRVQRNAQGDAVDRRHHVGAARSGKLRHLSVREGGRSRAAGGVHR